MKRKIALPIFLLAAVLCAVWSFIEAKQPTPASLREQLISALDSADAVYFEPDSLESNQPEGPVTDAKYVEGLPRRNSIFFPRRPLCCFPAMAARN